MNILANTLTIVILADWNKLYVQPDWVAMNIFEKTEMEIGVETQGVEYSISYKCEDVTINPTQDKVIITAANLNSKTIDLFVRCATNYFTKAITPHLSAWGLNIDYIESENTLLADIFDSITDSKAYIGLNYEITNTQIERTLVKDNRVINIQYSQKSSQTLIHFNEHHNCPNENDRSVSKESIWSFITLTKEIVAAIGYELEAEDE